MTGLDPNAAKKFGENIADESNEVFDALQAFKNSILDQRKTYHPPIPILSIIQNGESISVLTLKSFSLVQGKQKSKKSTLIAMAAAAFIRPERINDSIRFEPNDSQRGTVIIFDNEQGESYAARTMKLILTLAGVSESPNLIYCDLREFTPCYRMEIIKASIENTTNIKWVVIDGIVDIMNDFMSAEEGHMVITDLLKLCSQYDIHVTGVLHQNKGASKDARAHVGSIAGQKCEIEIMVERDSDDKSLSVVSAKESRGLPFEDFAINWPKCGLPHIVQDWIQKSVDQNTGAERSIAPYDLDLNVHQKILDKTFYNRSDKLMRSILKPAIQIAVSEQQNLKKPIGLNKADQWIEYWLENGLLDHEGTPGTKSSKFFKKYA